MDRLSPGFARVAPHHALRTVVAAVLGAWPEHQGYCDARFGADEPEFLARTEVVAQRILRLIDGRLDAYASAYRWMCEAFVVEEIHFARQRTYRLASFAEAEQEIYGNREYMERYVRGILVSLVLWTPHARAMDCFRTTYLPSLAPGSDYLEIGPGHGLYLSFAADAEALGSIEAWDISDTSLLETEAALGRLGIARRVTLRAADIQHATLEPETHDAVVISEVLEHLEDPIGALRALHSTLRPGGTIFINAPVNSPAPDHIYLWRSPEALVDDIRASGFTITQQLNLPVTGASLDRALKRSLSISCVVIARKVGVQQP